MQRIFIISIVPVTIDFKGGQGYGVERDEVQASVSGKDNGND